MSALQKAVARTIAIVMRTRDLSQAASFAAAERSWKKRDTVGWRLWRAVEKELASKELKA